MYDVLRLENISLTYQAENGEVEALKDISFCAKSGEQIAIVGPSGSGKSTLLSIIGGLMPQTSGDIFLAGAPLSGVSDKVGYMMQKDNLLTWRSVWQNILLGLELRKNKSPENVDYAENLLINYGLKDFKNKYPSQLSGGMRQRVALIRTLATRPSLLLLDEAFSALDYQTRLNVTDDVYGILRKEGVTALMVTHDIPESISMSDKIIVLTDRPGTIRSIHDIGFDTATDIPPLKRRNHEAFGGYFNAIWEELNNDD